MVALTDASGAVSHSYTYDPYGVTTETTASGAVANPWRYTGQYQDAATGLYKMGARYYQPELGRWTQPDPSGQEANAYLYAGGNPANFIDPSGLSFFSEFKDYVLAEDVDKANDVPAYNNRFSNAEATAAEATRDAGEFIGRNAFTAYKYGYACLEAGLAGYQSLKTFPGSLRPSGRLFAARLVLDSNTLAASREQQTYHEELVVLWGGLRCLRCNYHLRKDRWKPSAGAGGNSTMSGA